MREIKFRIWDREDTVMRYFTLDEMLERRLGNYYGSFDLKVLREEKMQYTGLKDKNGKEIYEGDILKRSEYLFADKYRDVFKKVWYSDESEWMVGNSMLSLVYAECEVIGNTYEIKELPK